MVDDEALLVGLNGKIDAAALVGALVVVDLNVRLARVTLPVELEVRTLAEAAVVEGNFKSVVVVLYLGLQILSDRAVTRRPLARRL